MEAAEAQKNTATSLPSHDAGIRGKLLTTQEGMLATQDIPLQDNQVVPPLQVQVTPDEVGVSEAQFHTLFMALSEKFARQTNVDLNAEPSQTHSNVVTLVEGPQREGVTHDELESEENPRFCGEVLREERSAETRGERRQTRNPRYQSPVRESRRNREIVQYNPSYPNDEYSCDSAPEGNDCYKYPPCERNPGIEDYPSWEGRPVDANIRRTNSRRGDGQEQPVRKPHRQSRVYRRPRGPIEIRQDHSMTNEEIYSAQKALDLEKNRLDKMIRARRVVTFDESLDHRPNPLCGRIRVDKIDPNKKVPNLPCYNGNSCPTEHFLHYEGPMEAQGRNQNVMAALFQTTLYGTAMEWYTGLDSGSILSFGQLAREFIRHFGNFKKRKRPYSCLAEIVQGEDESFSSFVHLFDAMHYLWENCP